MRRADSTLVVVARSRCGSWRVDSLAGVGGAIAAFGANTATGRVGALLLTPNGR